MKLLLMLLLCLSQAHAAIEVYDSTCNKPTPIKHKWYFDPVSGDDTLGDGSQLKPWKSIQTVFTPVGAIAPRFNQVPYAHVTDGVRAITPNPAAPIKPGDALELMTGNHGALSYGVFTFGINPSDWLTVEPALGQKPVLTGIYLSGVTKVYIHDIKVQSANPGSTQPGIIALGGQGTSATNETEFSQYPATDIIFDRLIVNSIDDASGWVANDWNTKPRNGFYINAFMARCVSITNSTVSNVAGGFAIGGEKVVVAHNSLNYFRDDGLDFYGNLLNIHHNKMTNSISVSEIHKDFMQGQIGRRFTGTTCNHYHDIVIDSNTLLGKTEAKNTLYTYTQGINTFDEDWTNLKVTNNTVVAAACQGIGFGSVHNGEIANNVVMHDGLTVTPGCTRLGIGGGGKSHEGTPGDHIRIHHNVSQAYTIFLENDNTWDNNICTGNDCQWVTTIGGVTNFNAGPGPNDTNKNDKQFVQFSPQGYRYNMAAPAGSLAQMMKAGVQ